MSGPNIGANGHVHADIAGDTGQHRADQKSDPGQWAQEEPGNNKNNGADHGDRTVLAIQIGHRPYLHSAGNLAHFVRTGSGPNHCPRGDNRIKKAKDAARDHEPMHTRHSSP